MTRHRHALLSIGVLYLHAATVNANSCAEALLHNFERMDLDANGALSRAEIRKGFHALHVNVAATVDDASCVSAQPHCRYIHEALECPAVTDGPSSAAVSEVANVRELNASPQQYLELGHKVELPRGTSSKRVKSRTTGELFSHVPGMSTDGHLGNQLHKLLTEYEFQTVADIGAGSGYFSRYFVLHNKTVTAFELGARFNVTSAADLVSHELRPGHGTNNFDNVRVVFGNFMCAPVREQFDAIWVHHVLEHILDPHLFLLKVFAMLKEGGVLAIAVPPLKSQIVGGHVSLWVGGLLIQHLVRAGFDCTSMRMYKIDYEIAVILRKKSIREKLTWTHDKGDISERISRYVPDVLRRTAISTAVKHGDGFEGNILSMNW